MSGFAKKPRAVMCYICGREYGTASIKIHQKQCAQKWEKEESRKPRHLRKPLPQEPEALTGNDIASIDAYNDKAYDKWKTEALAACPNCARTFLPDRLEIHMRSCMKGQATTQRQTSKYGEPVKEKTFNRPVAVLCHIWGREYGTKSIGIHQKQWAKRWEQEQMKLPKAQRRPVPQAPDEPVDSSNRQTLNEYNSRAAKNWETQALEKCPKCSRTFLPDRLQVHMRSCMKGQSPGPEGYSQYSQSEDIKPKTFNKPKAVMCHICGREYGTKSIAIHQKQWIKRWEQEEAKKPKHLRKPVPTGPENIDASNPSQLDAYNDAAYNTWSNKALEQCPNCKRTFLPDRLQVHMRSCMKDKGGGEQKQEIDRRSFSEPKTNKGMASRPVAVMCHICGREYGTKSIAIHVKQCTKKFEDEEKKKPVKDRRPVPEAPQQGAQGNLQKYNNEAFDKYNKQALEQCDQCGRTFLPDRLIIHQRSCKGQVARHATENKLPRLKADDVSKSSDGLYSLPKVRRNMPDVQEMSTPPPRLRKPKETLSPDRPSRITQSESKRLMVPNQSPDLVEDTPVRRKNPTMRNRISERSPQMDDGPSEFDMGQANNLVPCGVWGRKFAENRIDKHESACQKISKPRKIYDTKNQRMTEEMASAPKGYAPPKKKVDKGLWKKQHEDFVNNIKYARKIADVEARGGDINAIEAPKMNIDPYADYKQCMYWQRRFAPDVAAKHIPRCKEIKSKPKPLRR